ncbi:NAD(P)/FAD-dependent oxidoreductase [Allorhizocola rhizosphaerae]|uniref:NAD(P)/FAD-dependent oxidoreductase n=1 Tax=Allorhizocola rhizosphaerae TaxID=1872709 RepID=UPI001B8D8072|nr:NAD(P)/FAD-dependent oxidoreductase [Allorhizocola rhizosphaerae]
MIQSACSHSADVVDVVVIGAGPGGCSAAAELARRGHSVRVLERRGFPRFHIGESLLPYMVGVLDRMGLRERVAGQGYVVKRGAEFTGPDGEFRRVDFTAQGPGRYHETFQVERAHFDNLLAQHARELGADFSYHTNVTELITDGGRVCGVRYTKDGKAGAVRARYVIDAAGRGSKAASAFQLRHTVDKLRMVAVYRHFTDLDEANNPGHEGDIQIGNHPDGWLWAIPIWPDTISIGAVMPKDRLRSRDPEQIFNDHLARIPRITRRLTGTRPLSEVRVETDYCYRSDTVAGEGWLMIGDSGCFLDPIFSGGVYLAMVTGARAAEVIHEALAAPVHEAEVMRDYENFYKTGYDTYSRLIQAFYECDFNFGRYVASLPAHIERRWMARLLSGDFWSGVNPLNRLLRDNHDYDIFAPFEPVYGCPVYPHLDVAEDVAEDAEPEQLTRTG